MYELQGCIRALPPVHAGLYRGGKRRVQRACGDLFEPAISEIHTGTYKKHQNIAGSLVRYLVISIETFKKIQVITWCPTRHHLLKARKMFAQKLVAFKGHQTIIR